MIRREPARRGRRWAVGALALATIGTLACEDDGSDRGGVGGDVDGGSDVAGTDGDDPQQRTNQFDGESDYEEEYGQFDDGGDAEGGDGGGGGTGSGG